MNRRVIFIACITVAVALLFWYSSVLQGAFYVIVGFFNELVLRNEPLAALLFILIATAAALVSPFTNIPLVPVAVAIWGVVPTTVLLLGGWIIGDLLAYFIGRYLGYPAVRYLISAERFDGWVSTVKAHTSFSLALFLRLALPAELGYAFGIIRYHAGKYILITFLAELPIAVIATYASEAIILGDTVQFFAIIGILLVILLAAFRFTKIKSPW